MDFIEEANFEMISSLNNFFERIFIRLTTFVVYPLECSRAVWHNHSLRNSHP